MRPAEFFGIQIYSSKPIALEAIPTLVVPSPYESMETTNALIAQGVVFFRDSEHAQGAFSETFVGDGFYTQMQINETTGAVIKTLMHNHNCHILRVFPDGVTREMEPLPNARISALTVAETP